MPQFNNHLVHMPHLTTSFCMCILQMIKYWWWLWSGNKAYHSTL